MQIRLAGDNFELELKDLVDRLEGYAPDAVNTYSVEVGGVRWPVKQAMSIVTGVHPNEFTSRDARKQLQKIGAPIESAQLAPAPQRNTRTAPAREFDSLAVVAADALRVEVRFTWNEVGHVVLDEAHFPSFPALPDDPGLYRFEFGTDGDGRKVYYIGESKNLSGRARQYRRAKMDREKPLTSRRLHRKMVEHLSDGGKITMFIVTDVELGGGLRLPLSRKSGRLLAESAAVVTAQLDAGVILLNIDKDLSRDASD